MANKGGIIKRNTNIKIKCFKCGNEYSMNMMRIGPDKKNLMCRNCLERKPIQKQEILNPVADSKIQKQESAMKEYFCKECKYNFKRAKHLAITTCPYCGAPCSLMVKGSAARIIADVAKMKGD